MVCKKVIFPKLVDLPEANVPDTYTICEDHEEWTDEQQLLFQKAVSDIINAGKPFAEHYIIRVDKPQSIKKYPATPYTIDDSRFAPKDALDV